MILSNPLDFCFDWSSTPLGFIIVVIIFFYVLKVFHCFFIGVRGASFLGTSVFPKLLGIQQY